MTTHEVARYTAVSLPFNLCSMRELYNIEYRQGRKTIGYDLWQAMITAQADYSAAQEYDPDTTYSADDVAKYKGVYYAATEETTGTPPSNTASWIEAPKFDPANPCANEYEELWCTFLAPYLANLTLAQRLPYVHTQIKDIGVLNYGGDSYDTADETSYDRLIKALYRDAELIKANMSHYANLTDTECFAGFVGLDKKDDCDAGKTGEGNRTGAARRVPGGYDFG